MPVVLEGPPVCAACKLSLIHRVLSAREPDKQCYYDHPSPTEKKLRQLWGGGCRVCPMGEKEEAAVEAKTRGLAPSVSPEDLALR